MNLPKIGENWTRDGLRRLANLDSVPGTLSYVLRELFEDLDRAQRDLKREAERVGAVTRVTLVDSGGRAYERWNVFVRLDYQDEGRTLKVFVDESRSSQK